MAAALITGCWQGPSFWVQCPIKTHMIIVFKTAGQNNHQVNQLEGGRLTPQKPAGFHVNMERQRQPADGSLSIVANDADPVFWSVLQHGWSCRNFVREEFAGLNHVLNDLLKIPSHPTLAVLRLGPPLSG